MILINVGIIILIMIILPWNFEAPPTWTSQRRCTNPAEQMANFQKEELFVISKPTNDIHMPLRGCPDNKISKIFRCFDLGLGELPQEEADRRG